LRCLSTNIYFFPALIETLNYFAVIVNELADYDKSSTAQIQQEHASIKKAKEL